MSCSEFHDIYICMCTYAYITGVPKNCPHICILREVAKNCTTNTFPILSMQFCISSFQFQICISRFHFQKCFSSFAFTEEHFQKQNSETEGRVGCAGLKGEDAFDSSAGGCVSLQCKSPTRPSYMQFSELIDQKYDCRDKPDDQHCEDNCID